MLESLKLTYYDRREMKKLIINISVKGGQIYHTVSDAIMKNDMTKDKEAYYMSTSWLKKFAALEIDSWERRYKNETGTKDFVEWQIDYKYMGELKKNIYGINMTPPKWDEFIDLIFEVAPESGIKERLS